MALGKTRDGADLGLHHPGNPRACTPSGQLYTTLEHQHPAPAQLVLHRGMRLVVSGHSKSLQLTGLGTSLPLICQQQSRLNYNRRVCLAHTKGTPQVPSLGDGEAVPLDPMGHLLHKSTLPTPRVKVALFNTQKQTQGSCQMSRQTRPK